MREQVMALVRAHFRPEFLNRVDEIILFHRLQKSEMGRIVDTQFARLQKLLEDRKIELSLELESTPLAGGQGLRSRLLRAPAQAGDPAQRAGSAGRDDPCRRRARRFLSKALRGQGGPHFQWQKAADDGCG